jgi:hypothetical protein
MMTLGFDFWLIKINKKILQPGANPMTSKFTTLTPALY